MKDNLIQHEIILTNFNLCLSGSGLKESDNHLFLECYFYGSFWSLIWQWLGIHSAYHFFYHVIQFGSVRGDPRKKLFFCSIDLVSLYRCCWEGCYQSFIRYS